MKRVLIILTMLVLVFNLFACNVDEEKSLPPQADMIDDNYRTFYQIFVGSFSDSNNDGIGDLGGIINRFDYLNDGNINSGKSLGIQGIWLSPIFSSPSYHKYDVKDYYEVDWRFGNEDTLKELISLCKERNVKLILDLVLNHTSSSHEWFLKFKEARMNGDTESEYYDFYTCVTTADKKGGVAYQKIAGVDAWYECNFSGDMPELNYDNQKVRQEMLNIAKYYLDLGIDGFRFDAIKYVYFGDTNSNIEFWDWYMSELKKINPDIYCVGECWSGENEIIEYNEALNCFNFTSSQGEGAIVKASRGGSIANYTGYISSYQNKLNLKNPEAMPISFLSNHDMDRIGGVFATENYMKMAASLYLLSPGSPFIYYGEEIGMKGSRGSANTDANRRLAMLWGDDDMIKDPIGSTYPSDKQVQVTVKEQIEDENSLYNYYCKLISIRHKYPEIARGIYSPLNISAKFGGFVIEYNGNKTILLHNTDLNATEVDLKDNALLSKYNISSISDYIGGKASIEGNILKIGGQTSVIIIIN